MSSFLQNTLINFIRTSVSEQSEFLKTHGVLLDIDIHNGEQINLYFLDGFFAEEVMSTETREVKEIIPFRQGYRMSQFVKSQGGNPAAASTVKGTASLNHTSTSSAIS